MGANFIEAPELSDHTGAEGLARRIEAYWSEQGFRIRTRLESLTTGKIGGSPIYGVRSNLVGGLPPKGARA